MYGNQESELSRRIEFESLNPHAVDSLVEFLRVYYFVSNVRSLTGPTSLRRIGDSEYLFSFGARLDQGPPYSITLRAGRGSVEINAAPNGPPTDEVRAEFRRLTDGIEFMVKSFFVYSRSTKAYFLFSKPNRISTEAPPAGSMKPTRSFMRRILHGNAMNMFLFFLLISFVFVFILGDYALVAIIVVQSLALFFSDRLSLAVGSVRPSREEPDVAIVSVQLDPASLKRMKGDRKLVAEIRSSAGQAIYSGGRDEEVKSSLVSTLAEHGISVGPERIQIKIEQVYKVVNSAAAKFGLPVPKVVISNTPAGNASAMGISPGRSTITVTAGALEDLDDDELESVVGHELGHIKGRDPVILFGLTSLMYIGGFYLWVPLLLFLGFFYFVFAFGIVFLVGKFLETRADTESANAIGRGDVLARALTAISFRQLYFERYSTGTRVLDWLRFDPHPPTYFRVRRLYRLWSTGEKVRHTLLVSTVDCVRGFFRALAGE